MLWQLWTVDKLTPPQRTGNILLLSNREYLSYLLHESRHNIVAAGPVMLELWSRTSVTVTSIVFGLPTINPKFYCNFRTPYQVKRGIVDVITDLTFYGVPTDMSRNRTYL